MTQIDAAYAWRYIRAVRAGAPAGDAAVTVTADGGWQTRARVTAAAAALFDTLLPVATGGRDYVIAQLGQSLDGRIATASGASHYVTGKAGRTHLHRLRALVDAVVVGAGTATADDPRLTVRLAEGRNPVRVILDPNARVPAESRVFNDRAAPTIRVVAEGSAQRNAGARGERLALPFGPAGIEPATLLAALAARGLSRVLVEGGGQTVSRFVDARRLDRLHIVVAPMLIGSGRPGLSLAPIETLAAARRPPCRTHTLGADRLFDLDLGGA